jgi:hypothetical protein
MDEGASSSPDASSTKMSEVPSHFERQEQERLIVLVEKE